MALYTVTHVDEVPDLSGDRFPGEFKMLAKPLDTEQVAFTFRSIPPDFGGILGERTGHSHRTQEEIYYVISGTLRVKVGEEEIEVGPRTAIRFAPQAVRAVWNDGPETVEMVMVSTKVDDLRGEAEMHPDFWEE
jgi:mannose-6-phosphate isomerase-like protein (cupin superfamily)